MWAIISDSHDNLDAISKAINIISKHPKDIELIFHCGDLISPFTVSKFDCGIPVKAVRGNNDGEFFGLQKKFESFSNWVFTQGVLSLDTEFGKVAVTHGHIPGVLHALLSGSEYKFVFSGHDHISNIELISFDRLYVNPGECGGWLKGKKTFALVEPKELRAEIIEFK